MKFLISATALWAPTEEIVERYPCLKDYNFEIVEFQRAIIKRIRDENGKWVVFDDGKAEYKTEKKPYIQINDFESFVELGRKVHHPLILMLEGEPEIEIYDAYRE